MKIFLNILSALALLVWCVCFAFGYNYMEGDALVLSCLLGVVLLAVMGLMLYLMMRWSNPRSTDHKASAKTREIICCVIYAIIVALSATGVAQFVTVQSTVKNQVKPLVAERIDELTRVFGNEDQPESYESYLSAMSRSYAIYVNAKYDNLKESEKSKNVTLALARFKDEMTQDGSFYSLQDDFKNFKRKCKNAVDNWIPWDVTTAITTLDKKLPEWESEVTKMSSNHEWINTKNERYVINSVASGTLIGKITDPEGGVFSGMAITVIIVLQVIILLSYLAGRNWSGKGPVKPKSNVSYVTWNDK